MAVHEKVPFAPRGLTGERVAEREDCFDMADIRQDDPWGGLDGVVELQRRPRWGSYARKPSGSGQSGSCEAELAKTLAADLGAGRPAGHHGPARPLRA